METAPDSLDGQTHAVISTPWSARAEILRRLPKTIDYILFEKPFAVSQTHLSEMNLLTQNRFAYVLHNYRLKQNVSTLRRFKGRYLSGRLRHVMLRYETPSPFIEKSAWIRQEKKHRILVTDYGLHFLDLAWIFFEGPMKIQQLRTAENSRGEIESVSGHLSFDEGDCTFVIRQGCHRREARIHYGSRIMTLSFDSSPMCLRRRSEGIQPLTTSGLALKSVRPTIVKVADKLGLATADRSHDPILAAFLGLGNPGLIDEFSVERLLPFYERLVKLADAVYE